MFKKLLESTLAQGFTLAGSVIVIITLSGETQRTAIIATAIAVVFHYWHVLRTKDD